MKADIILVASLSIATLFSCQRVYENVVLECEPNVHTLSVRFPEMTDQNGTKVSLATTGKTQWEVGDKLVIFGQPSSEDATKRVVHEIVAGDITDPEVAVFDVDLSGLTPENASDNNEFAHRFNVIYPYTEGQQYYYSTGKYNYGRARFQNTNQLLLAGYVSDNLSFIELSPVTAAITFSVSGEFDSYIFSGKDGDEVVGYSDLAVEMNSTSAPKYRQKYNEGGTSGPLTSISGSVNGDGTAINHIFLPVNAQRSGSSPSYTYDTESARLANVLYLPNGFTIKFLQGGVIKKYISSSAPLVMEPGHMINLGLLPAEKIHDYVSPGHSSSIPIESAKSDLGAANGTANCYFINPADAITNEKGSIFKFEAVKGNSSETVDDIASVSVLWRTFNNATTPGDADVVKGADYDDTGAKTYIVFQLPDTHQPGNAVIAAKNSGGEILWSWHIWVPATTITSAAYNNIASATNIMDRNLGALVTATNATATKVALESIGLYYQWGRKDPFVGAKSFDQYPGSAKVAGTQWARVDNTSETITVATAIANPTSLYYQYHVSESDWLTESIDNLWDDEKTMYDPCPPGYKVPAYDSSKVLWQQSDEGWTFDFDNARFTHSSSTAVFPIAGLVDSYGGSISNPGSESFIWSSTKYKSGDNRAYAAYIRQSKTPKYYYPKYYKAVAGSVRCVSENQVDPLDEEAQRLARLGRTPIVSTYFTKNTPNAEFPTLADVRCFTHINVGPVRFVNKTTGDGGLEIPSPGATYMQQLAAYKQDYPELKLLLFIGGWGQNGDGFSEMAKDPDKRALFCSECLRLCDEYNFDGVDIDWEYPTYAATDGNHVNGADPADTENFTILMQELRETLGHNRLISYAASDSGYYINNAEVLQWVDYINVMTYSMGNPPYHNSPLYHSTLTKSRSGEESIEIFHNQGVPYNRMNYGLAFYGHADGTIYPSSMPYNKIVDALTTGYVDGKSVAGYNIRCWDNVGKNVYLGDGSGNMYASYEDTESLSYRVAFVKEKGMLGAFSWEYREDAQDGTLRKYVYNAFYPSE